MEYNNVVLKPDERAMFGLRQLYGRYGYQHYKVGKFEEYDLYAGNKSFLISDNILTFTDTNGKLMALKPDVTLSIVKNIGDNDTSTHKYFYNENVYRTSASSGGFREIMQTGLECIGEIDLYSTCEVLMLAQKSLESMSADSLLVLSHMGFTLGLLDECKFSSKQKQEALSYIESKNVQAIRGMAASAGLFTELREALEFTARFYGTLDMALESIEKYSFNETMKSAFSELANISKAIKQLNGDAELYVDFSIVNDMNYYNGIIFKGYINGIPEFVLSGGRYDSLLKKMGKSSGAIGFAVYLDLLERFGESASDSGVDLLLLYDGASDIESVTSAVKSAVSEGKSVRISKSAQGIKCRQIARVGKEGVELLEGND